MVDQKFFFRYDGKTFETTANAKCQHDSTLGLANYRGKALTTGSRYSFACGNKTEIYDFESNQWDNAPEYPFAE